MTQLQSNDRSVQAFSTVLQCYVILHNYMSADKLQVRVHVYTLNTYRHIHTCLFMYEVCIVQCAVP
jgi:hypothetical protein